MGSWFSNVHIKRRAGITYIRIAQYLSKLMATRGYELVHTADESHCTFAIVNDKQSGWYTLYSDLFTFGTTENFQEFGRPMSHAFKTDVLGIACFDSDFLFLNLLDEIGGVDARATVGFPMEEEFFEDTDLSPWEQKVKDFPRFLESMQGDYVFAEEVLSEIAPCLNLPEKRSNFGFDYLGECEDDVEITYMYFRKPPETETLPPALEQISTDLRPVLIDRPGVINAVNTGRESKGLSVFFLGPYVEHEEITFDQVAFLKPNKRGNYDEIPIQLRKEQLPDGQWVYAYHDPEYLIQPKVEELVSWAKRDHLREERSIKVRFIPRGNGRKVLDITVVLYPHENPAGQTAWNVWRCSGSKSKREYIRQQNALWAGIPNSESMLLKEEDFD